MAILIGCGSWSDADYKGLLYPKGAEAMEKLSGYARFFDHIELNASYHRTPSREQVKNWVAATPKQFIFDVKLHQDLSRRPGSYQSFLPPMLKNFEPFFESGKFGVFLFMLSPRFSAEENQLDELDGLLAALESYGMAVELRNRSWVEGVEREKTLGYFRKRKAAWVTVDMPDVKKDGVMPPVDEVTSPKLAYLRLHGRNKEGYLHGKEAKARHDYLYSEAELKEIMRRIKKLSAEAKDLRVVCNNHFKDYAPRTAIRLKQLLGQKVPAVEGGGQEELF